MPYYLSSYIGTGTALDPFRPKGSEQPGWRAIDMRPDGGRTKDGNGLNACLLYLPKHDPSLYQLATDKREAVTGTLRTRLFSKLHLDTPFKAFRDVIADALMLPPSGGWNAIKPARGRFEIWLGDLLWSMPLMAGGTSLSSTFTGTPTPPSLDSDGLTWTLQVADSWSIDTNRASFFGDVGQNNARCNSDLSTVNMECQATLVSLNNGSGANLHGPAVRFPTANADVCYYMAAVWSSAVGRHDLRKCTDASTNTQIATDTTDPTSSSLLKCHATGSSISGYRAGSVLLGPVTDSAIDGVTVGGKRCGFGGFSSVSSAINAVFDDWSAQDLVSGATLSGSASTSGHGTTVPNFQIPL
jgi:hypothetical protein